MSAAQSPPNDPTLPTRLTVQEAYAIERAVAARIMSYILLETRSAYCYGEEPFTFTSGRKSPVYIDCRQLISFPRARTKLMDLAVEMIERDIGFESIDVVAGGETAGIAFAAWIAERMSLPMVYVRKQPKGFGRMAQIEGVMPEGSRVLLVEDLATDGGSKVNFINAIRNAGGVIQDCVVLFHYGIYPASVSSLAQVGVKLHGLATWWDVIAEAEARGYFPPEKAREVRAFLNDPEGWMPAAD
jgi:orotate phosphoribosyltransferase